MTSQQSQKGIFYDDRQLGIEKKWIFLNVRREKGSKIEILEWNNFLELHIRMRNYV